MTVVLADDITAKVRAGDDLAAARLMTWAERADARFERLHAEFSPSLGAAMRVGVTGPPGAGKSTLVQGLALHWRAAGRRLGVLAVDPTSPFSGGALLGDRVRMSRLALDPGVFIRSMATRGAFGGLARAADDVADVLELTGRDAILIETVGVGQSEIDVARSADLTVVVLHPGAGDTIQAMKAGLMEIADLYLVNKADLPGAERLVAEITDILDLREVPVDERPPILTASAEQGAGVGDLAEALDRLHADWRASGRLERRRATNFERRVRRLVDGWMTRSVWVDAGLAARLAEQAQDRDGRSAYGVARALLDGYRAHESDDGERAR